MSTQLMPTDTRLTQTLVGIHEIAAADEATTGPLARVALARIGVGQPGFQRQREAAEQLLHHLLSLSFPGRASEWRLIRSPSGAPRLDCLTDKGFQLRVSMSHRANWIVAGVTREVSLGVDVELAKAGRDTGRLAAFFGWESIAPTEEAFYRQWVLWEAYTKCRERPLFDAAGPEFERLACQRASARAGCWAAFDLPVATRVYASVVLLTAMPRTLILRTLDVNRPIPW